MLNGLKRNRIFEIFGLMVLAGLLILSYFLFAKTLFFFALFIAAVFIVLYLYLIVKNMLLLFMFAILIFPLSNYASPPVSIGINDYHIIGGFILLLVYLLFKNILNYNNIKNKINFMPVTFILFEGVLIIFTIMGYLKGYKSEWLVREFFYQSLYVMVLLFVDESNTVKFAKKFEKTIFLATAIIFIEYCLRYYYNYVHFDFKRVVTQQANIELFAFPLAFFSLFIKQSVMSRAVRIAICIIGIILALLSLQRSLWLILFADIILGLGYFVFSLGFNRNTFRKIIIVIAVLAVFAAGSLIFMNKYFDIFKLLRERFNTMSSERISDDRALGVRQEDFKEVVRMVTDDSFMGAGIGAPVFQKNTGLIKEVIDNSYVIIIYKMGIIGLLSLLLIFFTSFIKAGRLLMHDRGNYIIFALIVSMLNYLVISISSSALFIYRFNLIIGIIFAIIINFKIINTSDIHE